MTPGDSTRAHQSGRAIRLLLSRRGSVAAIAREVENALAEKGYRVLTQDYDIPLGGSFVPLIIEALARLRSRSCILDGEAVCYDDDGRPSFDRIRYRRHDASVFLYVQNIP